jgi:hypothetical protein
MVTPRLRGHEPPKVLSRLHHIVVATALNRYGVPSQLHVECRARASINCGLAASFPVAVLRLYIDTTKGRKQANILVRVLYKYRSRQAGFARVTSRLTPSPTASGRTGYTSRGPLLRACCCKPRTNRSTKTFTSEDQVLVQHEEHADVVNDTRKTRTELRIRQFQEHCLSTTNPWRC